LASRNCGIECQGSIRQLCRARGAAPEHDICRYSSSRYRSWMSVSLNATRTLASPVAVRSQRESCKTRVSFGVPAVRICRISPPHERLTLVIRQASDWDVTMSSRHRDGKQPSRQVRSGAQELLNLAASATYPGGRADQSSALAAIAFSPLAPSLTGMLRAVGFGFCVLNPGGHSSIRLGASSGTWAAIKRAYIQYKTVFDTADVSRKQCPNAPSQIGHCTLVLR
jgi:hypothetical protein